MRTSNEINEIAGALAKAQAMLKPAHKDSTNPHYNSRYADLASVWAAWQVAGPANGLATFQDVSSERDEHGWVVSVTTRLLHASGQWMETEPLRIPLARVDAHGIGSGTTYGKRYGLAAAVGVVGDDEDDDGAAAVERPQEVRRAEGPTRIKTVEHKTGKNKNTGKTWQRWDVEFEDGRKASTFRQDVAALAQRIHAAGLLVTPAIESPDGRNQNLMGLETDGEVPTSEEPPFAYQAPDNGGGSLAVGGPTEADRAPLMKRVKALEIERRLTPDEKKELGRTIIGAGFSLATAPIPSLVSFVEFLEQPEAVAAWRQAQAKGAA